MMSGLEKSPEISPAVEHRAVEHSKDASHCSGQPRQKWYQWFAPTDSPAERRLILKLDGLIIVFVFLAYWAKVLDSSATSTAYVSGMKEDLKLYGNQLNYLNTVYMVGFITMQIPLTLVMTRCPVNYFLPAADLLWGVFTLAQYKASSVTQLYALRFFVGALGGFFFPAVQWYLGCWYKRSELSRRGAIFFIASQVGSMSSGYIQAGAYARLDGRYGIEGWRWLYIICFACTVPIAFLGLCVLPSTPESCKSRFLDADEILLARDRMASENREARQPFTRSTISHILKGWRLWVLVAFAFFFSQADGVSSNSGLPLWLKAEGYSVESINTITTVSPAVTIVASVVCAVLSDVYNAKATLIATTALLNIFACIVLAIWNVPVGLKFFAFFLSGTADGIAAIIYAWANEICAHSAEERAVVISAMNTIGNTFGAWIPLFAWKTVDAPRYLIGYSWTIALDVCMLVMLVVLNQFWRREQKLARSRIPCPRLVYTATSSQKCVSLPSRCSLVVAENIVTLFIPRRKEFQTNTLDGKVIGTKGSATSYLLKCPPGASDQDCEFPEKGYPVLAGPSTMFMSYSDAGSNLHGTTRAVCSGTYSESSETWSKFDTLDIAEMPSGGSQVVRITATQADASVFSTGTIIGSAAATTTTQTGPPTSTYAAILVVTGNTHRAVGGVGAALVLAVV
ncbi:hypothetical protein N7512_002419 [Penicillium capsulatum]|nr:hypothetical protein N7512_002419 [Penicillium capsulatum]